MSLFRGYIKSEKLGGSVTDIQVYPGPKGFLGMRL